MSSNTRDALGWVIGALMVLVPIASFAYSALRYGIFAAAMGVMTIIGVASVAYFAFILLEAVRGIIKAVHDTIVDDKRGRL